MDKLTLEHIAPYVSYDLQFIADDCQWLMTSLRTISKHPIWAECKWDKEKLKYEPEINNKGTFIGKGFKLKEVKPLLRPLSDLTKDEYWRLSGLNPDLNFGFYYGKHNGQNDKREFIQQEGYSDRKFFLEDGYGQFPYRMMLFFFKHHFDVFNLIGRNLAIDINTVKEGK